MGVERRSGAFTEGEKEDTLTPSQVYQERDAGTSHSIQFAKQRSLETVRWVGASLLTHVQASLLALTLRQAGIQIKLHL